MAVDQYALTTRAAVMQYMGLEGADISADGIDIYCDSSDATAATVQVTDVNMRLVITGGADAGTNTLLFADSDKDTLVELVAEINALSGWDATLVGLGATDSTNLIPTDSESVLGQANVKTLQYADLDLIDQLINRASDLIETVCDRKFASRDFIEWHDINPTDAVKTDNFPVTAVKRLAYGTDNALSVQATTATDIEAIVEVQDAAVVLRRFDSSGTEASTSLDFDTYPTTSDLVTQINATSGWSATLNKNVRSKVMHRRPGTDAKETVAYLTYPDHYDIVGRLAEDEGIIYVSAYDSGPWYPSEISYPGSIANCRGRPNVPQRIMVEYTGGYATIPDDVEQLCIEAVKKAYDSRGHDSSMQSESVGDYSYTLMSGVQQALDLESTLSRWKDIR